MPSALRLNILAARAWRCAVPTAPRWRDSGRYIPVKNYLFFTLLFFVHANRIQMHKNKTNTTQKGDAHGHGPPTVTFGFHWLCFMSRQLF
jgi:hypothetical protein